MMRIRTMELPSVVVGDYVSAPFVVILDRVRLEDLADTSSDALDQMGQSIREATGAHGVLFFFSEVEIGDPS